MQVHFELIFLFLSRSYFSCCMSLESTKWSSGWSPSCLGPVPRTGPLPSVLLPLQTRSPTQLPVQALCSAQRSSHTEKKKLKSTQSWGGRERGARKRPGNLVHREIGKEWQNPIRLQSCDWKKCFSWAEEKGRGHVFWGCSSWCEASWAQERLRTGKDAPFFFL